MFNTSDKDPDQPIPIIPGLFGLGIFLLVFNPGFLYLVAPLPVWFGSLAWNAILVGLLFWIGLKLKFQAPVWQPQIKEIPLIFFTFGILIFFGMIIGWWAPFLEPGPPDAVKKGTLDAFGPYSFLNLVIAAGLEETLFRWFLVESFCAMGLRWGFSGILQGVLFSGAHGFSEIHWWFFALVSGIILFLVYGKKRRLGTAILVHSLYNLSIWVF